MATPKLWSVTDYLLLQNGGLLFPASCRSHQHGLLQVSPWVLHSISVMMPYSFHQNHLIVSETPSLTLSGLELLNIFNVPKHLVESLSHAP